MVFPGGGWDAVFIGNHDLPRAVSVAGDERFWKESATCLATMVLSQWGTPFIYQGDEIGMINAGFANLNHFRDSHGISKVLEAKKKDRGKMMAEIIKCGRDNSRTPMQWDASPHGGFSETEPWIMMARKWKQINVAAQKNDPDSVLNYYKKMIFLRKSHKALAHGSMVMEDSPSRLLVYTRKYNNISLQVILNLSSTTVRYKTGAFHEEQVLIKNYPELKWNEKTLYLRPWECLVTEK